MFTYFTIIFQTVSSQIKWIKSIVCKNSGNAPCSFDCGNCGRDNDDVGSNPLNKPNAKPVNKPNNSPGNKPGSNGGKDKGKKKKKVSRNMTCFFCETG